LSFLKSLFGKREVHLDRLEKIIKYRFNDQQLLKTALSHRSSLKETGLDSNERLEFLGDAVLGLVVSSYLYKNNEEMPEGELTRMKALLVNETVLSRAALSFGLGEFLYLSAEEKKAGGNERPSITADAFEALLGAVYLDGGYDQAKRLVRRYILADSDDIIGDKKLQNYKGELLELMQSRAEGMPHYRVRDEIGPDHDKVFDVEVYINDQLLGEGRGKSKKEAEQDAARAALKTLRDQEPKLSQG
jgi:ribonuclease-3